MDEYFCPNCGATLNYQDGFDPSLSSLADSNPLHWNLYSQLFRRERGNVLRISSS